MDIFQYINSKDIRAHLENIGYQFNALEAAWLVYHCRTATMEEQHAAWREIIDTMPDMRVEFADDSQEPFESLHQLLRDYIAMEQRMFKSFVTPEKNAIYEYEYYEQEIDFRSSSGLFSEYDACFSAMKEELAPYKIGEISHIFINKRKVGNDEYAPFLIFDQYGAVKEVLGYDPKNEVERRKYNFFATLWFVFPTPFKKGDIVYDPNRNEGDFCQGPFVLTETAANVFRKMGQRMHDAKDMTAYGYFQKEDGTLYAECMHRYMDLERYPEEKLTGKKRILKALGNHLKGEIDAVLFARAYHQILLEESARESLPREITDEGLLLAGLTVETPEATARKQRRCFEAYREAAAFYHAQLFSYKGRSAREYLMTRGISAESIGRFSLGFAPDDWDTLCRHLMCKGFTLEELLVFDLIRKTNCGSEIDAFRNRLMFPIMDSQGNVIAFGGRTLNGSKPKYLNTAETIVYQKGQNLYGLHLAKNTAERRLILCEGYLDLITMHQAGFTNTVCCLGTSITDQQVSLLSRYCDELTLLFDADEAGQKATRRAMRMLSSSGLKLRVPKLEGGKDPDEIIRIRGKDKMEQILIAAPYEQTTLVSNTDNTDPGDDDLPF